MKKIIAVVTVACAGLFMFGCDNTPTGWYPTADGYINMRHAKQVRSRAVFATMTKDGIYAEKFYMEYGPITSERIKEAKKELSEASKIDTGRLLLEAYITIDDTKIILPTPKNISSTDDIEKTLDSWLASMEMVLEKMNSVKK